MSQTEVVPLAGTSTNGLARTLLLALAIVFLVLAVLPWQRLFAVKRFGKNVVRWRVAFLVIGLSVGFGYVLASYLNRGV